MNQDINLLTLPSGRRSQHPAAREVGIAVLCVIAIGIGGGLWYDHRDSTLARATRDLNAEIDDLVMNLEERSYFLAERDADLACRGMSRAAAGRQRQQVDVLVHTAIRCSAGLPCRETAPPSAK